MKKTILIVFMCVASVAADALSFIATHSGNGKLTVIFENYVGDNILQFDTVQYTNELGQSFTVTKFKYYIGNFHLRNVNGSGITYEDYYLADEEEPGSGTIHLDNLPAGEYTSIDFTIGVDSLHNCSGAQAGALDPVNAMFWAWNTGYIFLKLEGKSPASNSPGHIFEYHIGGYKQPHNCIRTVSLNFPNPIIVASGDTKELRIKTDVSEILKKPATIDFSKLSSVTDFHNATTIADNYMDMFSVISEK